jgi:hypothetical protein
MEDFHSSGSFLEIDPHVFGCMQASKAWIEWIMKKKKAFEQRGDMAVSAWAEQQQRELNLKARRMARLKVYIYIYSLLSPYMSIDVHCRWISSNPSSYPFSWQSRGTETYTHKMYIRIVCFILTRTMRKSSGIFADGS